MSSVAWYYFDRAFPSPIIAGGLSLLYLVTQIVSVAMIAKTFGAYADRLLLGDASAPIVSNLFASGIVIVLVLVNMVGSGAVGLIEELLVAAKLIILAALMIAGVPSIDPKMLSNGPTVGAATLLASVGLTFFAYAGYGMMTNAAGHVAIPHVTIPRAIFGLFVHPAYEGRGIARALLPLACEDLRAAGFSEATLTTGPGTRAERFYRENGWQETGRQVDGQGEDEIVFRKRL